MTPNLPHYHTTQFIVKLPIHLKRKGTNTICCKYRTVPFARMANKLR